MRYYIIPLIFRTVYLSCRLSDRKLVIIKQIPLEYLRNKEERQAALNEVKVLSMLDHPNIIEYYENFLEDKALMIVMEYAEGRITYTRTRIEGGSFSQRSTTWSSVTIPWCIRWGGLGVCLWLRTRRIQTFLAWSFLGRSGPSWPGPSVGCGQETVPSLLAPSPLWFTCQRDNGSYNTFAVRL